MPVQDFAETFLDDVGPELEGFLTESLGPEVGALLILAFGIAVGFVAYKLIKRALNKA